MVAALEFGSEYVINLSATHLSSFCVQVDGFHPRTVIAYFPFVISFHMQEHCKLFRKNCEIDKVRWCEEGLPSNYLKTWPKTREDFIVRQLYSLMICTIWQDNLVNLQYYNNH